MDTHYRCDEIVGLEKKEASRWNRWLARAEPRFVSGVVRMLGGG